MEDKGTEKGNMHKNSINGSCNTVMENRSLPVEEEITDLSEFFKVFGDPTRIRIITLLQLGECCVHTISSALGMHQTAISHQLKILRHKRLVRYRKEGKHVFYSLSDSHIDEILKTGFAHIQEQ